jgi:MerR family mercuric resistance operon transcriptional regulator
MRDDHLTTGRRARASGVTAETIRYYEQRKLLNCPPRTESGYRLYPGDSVRRIRFIRHAQRLGFTLDEIAELLALRADPKRSCADVKRRAERKIADIGSRIAALKRMRRALVAISASCEGAGSRSDCPILDALDRDEEQS